MQIIEVLELKKEAKKAGGDRYESDDGRMVIYIPQYISRTDGQAFQTIKITFEN